VEVEGQPGQRRLPEKEKKPEQQLHCPDYLKSFNMQVSLSWSPSLRVCEFVSLRVQCKCEAVDCHIYFSFECSAEIKLCHLAKQGRQCRAPWTHVSWLPSPPARGTREKGHAFSYNAAAEDCTLFSIL